jgi:hypothetical protein
LPGRNGGRGGDIEEIAVREQVDGVDLESEARVLAPRMSSERGVAWRAEDGPAAAGA